MASKGRLKRSGVCPGSETGSSRFKSLVSAVISIDIIIKSSSNVVKTVRVSFLTKYKCTGSWRPEGFAHRFVDIIIIDITTPSVASPPGRMPPPGLACPQVWAVK